MVKSLKKIESQDRTVWLTQPDEVEEFLKRQEIAFNVAKGKFADSNGNIELVLQTAEAFGRGLYSEQIKDKPNEWTVKEWLESTSNQIFNPMGTGATFTKIGNDEAKSLLFRCLLHEKSDEPHVASIFTYGFMRGMFLSAFPDGELLMGSTMAHGAPMTELIFKANASNDDRGERERIKNSFTKLKIVR